MSPAAPLGSPRACGDSGSHGAEVPQASAHPGPEPPPHPVAEPPQHPQPPPAGPWRPGPVGPSPVPSPPRAGPVLSGCPRHGRQDACAAGRGRRGRTAGVHGEPARPHTAATAP